MLSKGISLRGLEIFEALAQTGSVAETAQRLGLSRSAVSQQLRVLEASLAADLIDHNTRPMRLTRAGESFLQRAQAALAQLRLAQSELTVMDLAHLSDLSIGVIDDFDHDVTPQLITILARNLTRCRFRLTTAPSHKISEAISAKRLHIAISASFDPLPENIYEYPLVRDPFILVAPKGVIRPGRDILSQLTALPLLRYEKDQMIGRQIEGHLARQKLDFAGRFEIGSHLAMIALIARGIGWAVTTPLGYMLAARFHDEIEALPLPFKPFSRRIALFATAEWAGEVPTDIAQTSRRLIQAQVIEPVLAKLPWLSGELRVLEG